ncbi:Prolidase/Aminopeptidase P-like protein [Durotheca rogersii]|uniref:Prolidase/Aminopeptidase P-like protein n=1 Tax=Durotheca rogersii TaxID=419775 RepID=UPI00221EBECF|nr:Prolidase/Aminopeptidase P-like protein [Durotheca rogersii]KAI5865306.1 Prolidase/Aminopeptidase P-like protein [Durotheca rogersii]
MSTSKQLKRLVSQWEKSAPTYCHSRNFLTAGLSLFLSAWLIRLWVFRVARSEPDTVARVQACAVDNLRADLSFLDGASPITADEFLDRRDRLARALAAEGVDAFVCEPGYAFQFYGNVSQSDWEPWEPEERPFLMLILPAVSGDAVTATTAFLAPRFEEARARMLGIPSRDPGLNIVTWEEHWDPYATLLKSRLFTGKPRPMIAVDGEMRDFIARGLAGAGFETAAPPLAAERVRQLKSRAEVAALRAVNTGTVAAVRAMRPCLVVGLTEDEVRGVLDAALQSVGFSPFFDIVLFEEHGALPHGGAVVGAKQLTRETMVVIDVGAHYLGYSSDICRSFFIDPAVRSKRLLPRHLAGLFEMLGLRAHHAPEVLREMSDLHSEKLKVWSIVLDAQTAAAAEMKPGRSAATVDLAARGVIEAAGYGYGFTHRLGHGIGIKGERPRVPLLCLVLIQYHLAHEPPYLNQWNTEDILEPGMVVTDEPGIYLEGKFGVRHEDVYLVKPDGGAELLTGRRAGGPYDP